MCNLKPSEICFLSATGYSIFAIGVADADYSELVSIGSKPSARHVFFVDDFDAFKKIEDELITFVCETASASKFFEMCIYSCCLKAEIFYVS